MNSGAIKTLGRLTLVLGGVAAGLLLAEVAARLIQPDGGAHLLFNAPELEPRGLMREHPELDNELVPGFEGHMQGPGIDVLLRVNSLGLRGPEVEPLPEGGDRWIAIGDSFALSAQVPEEQTFEGRLAGKLGVDVWNGGVDGDSTYQSTARYLRVDEDLGSRAVVLIYFLGNDLNDNERRGRQPVSRPRGGGGGRADLPVEDTGLSARLDTFLIRHSYLMAHWRVYKRRGEIGGGRSIGNSQTWRNELALYTTEGTGLLSSLLPWTDKALEQLQTRTRRRGDRLLVALAPVVFEIETQRAGPTFELVGLDPETASLDAPREALLGVLDDLGIAGCDLAPPLRAARDEGVETYLRYDGHWSAEGHAVVADALHACILEHGLETPE